MRSATGQPEPGIDLSKIRELEQRLDNFRIHASDDMTIRGSAWQGYAINCPTCPEAQTVTPPIECPATILLTYNNLVLDCGCEVLGTTKSIIATDVDLSGRSVTLSRVTEGVCAPLFGWGVDGVDYCSYDFTSWSGTAPLHAVTYLDTVCSVAPLGWDVYPRPKVLMLHGVWYVFDYFQTGDGDAAIFIASTANPLLPIANAMTCSNPVDRSSNPIVQCHGPNLIGGVPVVPGVAHGGTVTITF